MRHSSAIRLTLLAAACANTNEPVIPAAADAVCIDATVPETSTSADASAAESTPSDAPLPDVVTAGAVLAFVALPDGVCAQPEDWTTASYITDGDTFEVAGGAKVRLLGIDTPEMTGDSGPECGAKNAKAALIQILPKDSKVCLQTDPAKTDKDKYGRLLRYAWVQQDGKTFQANAWLVRMGMARVYYPFAKGLQYESVLLELQQAAHDTETGSWKTCDW
jgi:micrococcal nuclease